MKRRIVIVASFFVIVSFVSFISYEYLTKERSYEKYKILPAFAFKTIHNDLQNTSELSNYNGYVIQIFNPGCEACQLEAADYSKNSDLLQNICFVMLSSDSISRIEDFAIKRQLYNSGNFLFGYIDSGEFENHFGHVAIPSLFIYNSEKKLVGKIRVANSEIIMDYFRNKKYKVDF